VLKSRARATALAVTLGLVALAVGGWQKYWRVWGRYTPEEMAAGKTKPFVANVRLGSYLAELADGEWEHRNPYRRQNLINLGLVAGVPIVVGLVAFWIAAPRRRPAAVADYAEVQGQSLPDGRTPAD
jgi:hypothetical protein